MDANTKPSLSKWPGTGSLRSMATYGRRSMRRVMISMCSAFSAVWVFFVCALILLPDIVTFRRRQSKTPAPGPNTRRLQMPIYDHKGRIFVINPDGSKVEIEPLMAANHARAWLDVVAAVYVWHETKLPD